MLDCVIEHVVYLSLLSTSRWISSALRDLRVFPRKRLCSWERSWNQLQQRSVDTGLYKFGIGSNVFSFEKLCYFDVVLIKPVLVSAGAVVKDFCPGFYNSLADGVALLLRRFGVSWNTPKAETYSWLTCFWLVRFGRERLQGALQLLYWVVTGLLFTDGCGGRV